MTFRSVPEQLPKHGVAIVALALAIGCVPALSAQEPHDPTVMVVPYLWAKSGDAAFGLHVQGPRFDGFVMPWIDLTWEHRECYLASVPVIPPEPSCDPRTWVGSAGLDLYLLRSRIAPYLGFGVGRRYWKRASSAWRSETVPILDAGVDLRSPTLRYTMRWEVLRRGDALTLVIGLGLGLF